MTDCSNTVFACRVTVVTKDLLSSSSGRYGDVDVAGVNVSYEQFVDVVNTALTSVTSSSGSGLMMVDNADADLVCQVAVLFRVTQLAVSAVGRGTRAAMSLLGLSARCYEEQFAARVASEQGLVNYLVIITTIIIIRWLSCGRPNGLTVLPERIQYNTNTIQNEFITRRLVQTKKPESETRCPL